MAFGRYSNDKDNLRCPFPVFAGVVRESYAGFFHGPYVFLLSAFSGLSSTLHSHTEYSNPPTTYWLLPSDARMAFLNFTQYFCPSFRGQSSSTILRRSRYVYRFPLKIKSSVSETWFGLLSGSWAIRTVGKRYGLLYFFYIMFILRGTCAWRRTSWIKFAFSFVILAFTFVMLRFHRRQHQQLTRVRLGLFLRRLSRPFCICFCYV